MIANKRFLTLLSLSLVSYAWGTDDGTPVENINDLITNASQSNLQFKNDVFDVDKLYKSQNGTSGNVSGVIDNSSTLTIDGNQHCFCLSEICLESTNAFSPCFITATNAITLTNFDRIASNETSQFARQTPDSALKLGAFINSQNITIENNKEVSFTNANSTVKMTRDSFWQPSILRAHGGTQTGCLCIQNNGDVSFKNNFSNQRGIIGGDKVQINNNSAVVFENNYSFGDGGAICSINQDKGGTDQKWKGRGIEINNNKSLCFRNNYASVGGAITCYNYLECSGNGPIIFDNNKSSYSGGAILIQKNALADKNTFVIKDNGDVTFSRNISQIGPAIAIFNHRVVQLALFATKGNITFLQNIKTNSSNKPLQCCSIEFIDTEYVGRIKYLCATKDHSINFYDPIKYQSTDPHENNGVYNYDLEINGSTPQEPPPPPPPPQGSPTIPTPGDLGFDDSKTYSGTILFSGSQIPAFLRKDPTKYNNSRTTDLFLKVNLHDGTLAIDQDTIFKCGTLNQTGGVLQLGSGSEFHTTGKKPYSGNNHSTAIFKDILIDLNTFGSSTAKPAVIQIDNAVTTANFDSSSVSVNDPQSFGFYDSYSVGDPVSFPILSISKNGGTQQGKPTAPEEPITINPQTGYAGTISFKWNEDSDGGQNPKILEATWLPTGYNCAPYFRTPTFLNTSWMGIAAAKSIASPLLPEKKSPFKHGLAGLSADALISSLNIRPSRGDENLHFTGHGYSLGCFLGEDLSSLEIRLGKLDGSAYNEKFNEEINVSFYLANICSKGSTFKTPVGEVYSALSLSYAYGKNNVYASYPDDVFGRRLSFHSRSFLAEFLLSKPLSGHGLSPLLRSTSPFLKATFSLGKNPGCQEVELTQDVITRQLLVPIQDFVQKLMIPPPARLRKYTPSTLYNLSISSGISTESISKWNTFPVSLRLAAAVSVDPYRVDPKSNMIIIQNAYPILVSGTSLARCSAEVATSFQIKLLPLLTSYVDYKGNFSTRNISNSVKLGSSLIF